MRRSVAVFLALAATAFAEEKSASAEKPAPAPAADEGIAFAKRDFDAIRAARGPQAAPSGASALDLSRLAVPEPQFGGTPSIDPRALPKKLDPKKKSANWLVDAMMKDPDKSADGKTEIENELSPDREKDEFAVAIQKLE